MRKFTHLHIHDKHSILDGLGGVEDFVKGAKDLGMDSLAQTNHGNLYGSYKFYKEGKKNGIKPILGQEFYVAPDKLAVKETRKMFHLTLLAKNNEGWDNLSKLSSIAFLDGFYYKPRIDRDVLEQHSKGLICLSGCLHGQISRTFLSDSLNEADSMYRWYRSLFGEDFYLELMPHQLEDQKKVNSYLLSLGGQMVVTNDAHYVKKEDEEYHGYLLKVNTSNQSDMGNFEFTVKDLYLKNGDQMYESLVQLGVDSEKAEVAVANSCKIADKVTEIEFDKSHKIPVYGGQV
jgi:DNA polymerase-3 subunit alpha